MQLHLPDESVKSLNSEKNPSEESNSTDYKMPSANMSVKEHEKNFKM